MALRPTWSVQRLSSAAPQARTQSRSSTLGPITLGRKQTGAPSAGNPHAGCDEAGTGNRLTDRLVRHSQRKRRATDRSVLRGTAPVLDPTLHPHHGVLETLAKIKGVTKDTVLTDTEKVQRIRALLADNHIATSLDADQIDELKAAVATELSEDDYYLILASKSVRLQNRVSPILKAVTFLAEPSARELRQAIEYFKLKDGAIDKTAPVECLTPEERQAVSRDGRFSVSLDKALLFLQVQSGIKSGTLNLEHSYKYRPLDAYLIDRDRWQRDKSLLIERAGLQAFVDPHQVLAELDEALYQQYLTTNTHILGGENPHITFKKVGFTLSTPTQEESEAGSMHQFFPERDFVPMLEILATVNHHTGWMEEFQHWQQRHHHGRPEERVIYAGVIGLGCTIGIRKMARISHPLSETELEDARSDERRG